MENWENIFVQLKQNICYVQTNVGSTFHVYYTFNLNNTWTQCFLVHFPHTQSVWLFSKLPF